MRARATVFLILGVTAMVALPALGYAQSPAVTRGVLPGDLVVARHDDRRRPRRRAARRGEESCVGRSHLEARPGYSRGRQPARRLACSRD